MNERQLRGIIKQVIRESHSPNTRLLVEDDEGGALYKAFVSPFVDVVKSANLFTKDILNIFGLAFETLITFSPEKLARSRAQYESRQKSIAQEWKPIMDRANASMKSTDIGLITMAFAPNIFFANQAAQLGSAGYNTVTEYLGAMGIIDYVSKEGGDLSTKLERWLDTQANDRSSGRSGGSGGGGKSISDRLRIFFLGENAVHYDSLLREADGDGPSVKEQLKELFSDEGPLSDALVSAREELIAAKKEQIQDLVGTANTVIVGLRSISQAEKTEDFEAAVVNLKAQLSQKSGDKAIDVGPIEKAIQDLKSIMEEKYKEVIAQNGAQENSKSPAPEGSKPEDVEMVAKKAASDAFQQGSEQLRKLATDTANKAVENYREAISSELTRDIPQKGSFADAFNKSRGGQELINLIKKAVDSIGATNVAS